jgi:hypothetical protein
MPLRHEGMSRGKSFFYGQLSAVVESFAAVANGRLRRYDDARRGSGITRVEDL